MIDRSMATRPSKKHTPASAKVSQVYEKEEEFEATLSKEQLQVLEKENNSLLEGFEQMLDQIKYRHRPEHRGICLRLEQPRRLY